MLSRLPLLLKISIFSTLLPFLNSIFLFKFFKDKKDYLFLFAFFTADIVTEIILTSYSILSKPNNWIIHIYSLLEYCLLVYILSLWQNDKRISKLIRISIPVFSVIYFLLKISGIERIDSNAINFISGPLSQLLIIGFASYTLHLLYLNTPSVLKEARFWILLALVSYYTGSTIIFAFMYVKSNHLLIFLAYSNACLNILRNILFVIGLIVAFIYKDKSLTRERALV